jgi:hypothetical protein
MEQIALAIEPAPTSAFHDLDRAAWKRANRTPNKAWAGVLSKTIPNADGLYKRQNIAISKGIGWQHVSDEKQLRPANGAEFYPTDLGIAVEALRQYQTDRPAPGRILDMGAGTGIWGAAARQLWPDAVIVGIELRNIMSQSHANIDPTMPVFDPMNPPPTVATAGRTSLAPDYDIWITGSLADPTALDLALAGGTFDLIMGNPPFSFAPGIVKWAWDEGLEYDRGRLFMLLRGAFLESQERNQLNQECPLARFMVFVQRPSFTQDGKTDATMYAMFEWDRTWTNDCFIGMRFNHKESKHE